MDLKALIRNIPDYPKPGILFRDITTLLRDRQALAYTVDAMTQLCREADLVPDYVAGIEARGFMFAPALACGLGAGFIPIRKGGKLPAAVQAIEYELEYGQDRLEVHEDAVGAGEKVLIFDDLIATGGTVAAASHLLMQSGCELIGFAFLIELSDLEGRKKLPDAPVVSLIQY